MAPYLGAAQGSKVVSADLVCRGVHRIFTWFFNVSANNQVGATPTQLASYNSSMFTMLTCMLSILADSTLNFLVLQLHNNM